ncbi:phage holin family protein [Arachnia propionica]|uniref:Phage holin family protein n=1 Tax=Arachnia propionica TaxID=1750 RepID=A0A3P1WTF3_9ACTN|nr:phage holin family protein [Arachnia propionica]RRD49188.1 phage holin family protein [Arachnia propionica]
MAQPNAFQLLRDSLTEFVSRESELAKAEILPAAKHAGIGSGLVGGAVAFLLHAIWMLVITIGFGVGWIFNALGVSFMGSLTLGFLVSLILAVLFAVILALLARRRFRKVKAPTATIEEAKATFIALTDSLAGQPSAVSPPDLTAELDH